MNKWIKVIINIIIFAVSIFLICTAQRHVGPAGLGVMVIGLGGILFLLYMYNRKFTK